MIFHAHVRGFLTSAEISALKGLVRAKESLFIEVSGRGGLGPSYQVIDGEQIRLHLPEIDHLGRQRILPALEKIVGAPVQLLESPRRCMRVQRYTQQKHGFRWHVDGHSFVALVALENNNQGQVQFFSPSFSRALKIFLYPLYFLPQVFSVFPFHRTALEPGDVLFFAGGKILHRGLTLQQDGERILLVFAYDEVGKKRTWLRDRIARALNY